MAGSSAAEKGRARCARRRWRHAQGGRLGAASQRVLGARLSVCGTPSRSVVPGSERLRFVNQHDGDPILDGIDQPAGLAHEGFRGCRYSVRPCIWGTRGCPAVRGPISSGSSDSGNPNRLNTASPRQLGNTLTRQSRKTGAPITLRGGPGLGADGLDGPATRADHDPFLRLPLNEQRHTNYSGRSFSRNSSTSAVSIRHLVLQLLERGFPEVLPHEKPDLLGADVLGIVVRTHLRAAELPT